MAIKYGRARKADLDALGAILSLSFGFPAESADNWFEKTGLENIRVVRHGAEIVGGLLLIPMGQYFGGRSVPCVGLAGVGVSPSVRGQGIGSEMMRRAVRELRRDGVALSSLYPASIPFYRRAGYEVAGAAWRYVVEGRNFPSCKPELAVRGYVDSDEEQVQAVYAACHAHRNGWLDRGPYVKERTRRKQDGSVTHGHVFHDEKERVEAYVFYRHKRAELGFELSVSDMAARTPRAYAELMAFLGGHKSMADSVNWLGGIDDPWLHHLPDRFYQVKLYHHWMLRVIDVPAALTARGYARGLDASLTLHVSDDAMPANSGSYRLRVSNGEGKVSVRGGGARRGGIELDIKALAALYTGHMDAHAAARLGLVLGGNKAIDTATELFSGPAPSMGDMF